MNAPANEGAPLNVLAVIDDLIAACAYLCTPDQNVEAIAARAAVAELIAANTEYFAACAACLHLASSGTHDERCAAGHRAHQAGHRLRSALALAGGVA